MDAFFFEIVHNRKSSVLSAGGTSSLFDSRSVDGTGRGGGSGSGGGGRNKAGSGDRTPTSNIGNGEQVQQQQQQQQEVGTLSKDNRGGSAERNHRGRGQRGVSVSSSSSESSSSSSEGGDDLQSICSEDEYQEVIKQILRHEHPIRIAIKLHINESVYTKWESVLNPVNNILYVAMPTKLAQDASKDTLLSLLEFAEDKLEVDAVVMCISRKRADRARLLESFLLMGFEALSRKAAEAPPAAEKDMDNFFLIYRIYDEEEVDEHN